VGTKTYKTLIPVTEDNNVLFKGQVMTTEEAITDLRTNHYAIELTEPIDYEEIILKHNHNMHTHAGIGYNDILRQNSSSGTDDED